MFVLGISTASVPLLYCCTARYLYRRDQSLYKVFQLALTALRHLHGTAADEKLKEQVRL